MKKSLAAIVSIAFFCSVSGQTTQALWATTHSSGANGGGTIIRMNSDGSGFSSVYNFNVATGCAPYGNMIQASDGMLYGTTELGGPSGSCVIFRYDPVSNIYTDVHDFWGPEGYIPFAGLVEFNGVLYGMTYDGGANNQGVIYSYDLATGVYTDVHDFISLDGTLPYGQLYVSNYEIYGMCHAGGASGFGTMFQFDPVSQILTVLHNFNDTAGGYAPFGSLIRASNGLLYGMTTAGGASNGGTLFSYNEQSGVYTQEYEFVTATGIFPKGELLQASDGKLYATLCQSASTTYGSVFSFDINSGVFTALHVFTGTEGSAPMGDLIQSANGFIYGTTSAGGANGQGVVFAIDPANGNYAVVHDLVASEGSMPYSGFNVVSTPLAIHDPVAVSNSLTVFNSLSHNEIDITASFSSGVSFRLLNSLGQNVKEWNESATANYHKLIDVSDLENGIYFLEMSNGTEVVTKKFVKE